MTSRIIRLTRCLAVLGLTSYIFIGFSVNVQLHQSKWVQSLEQNTETFVKENLRALTREAEYGRADNISIEQISGETDLRATNNEINLKGVLSDVNNTDAYNKTVDIFHRAEKYLKAMDLINRLPPALVSQQNEQPIVGNATKLNKSQTGYDAWKQNPIIQCDGKISLYNKLIAFYKNMVMDTSLCGDTKKGAENVSEVMKQPENNEFLHMKKGCFHLNCQEIDSLKTDLVTKGAPGHFASWFNSVKKDDFPDNEVDATKFSFNFTIAVVRYEYANVYWNLIDFYDSYLTARLNNHHLNETNILILDAHPKGHLDKWWKNTFASVLRLGDIPRISEFSTMSWLFARSESPVLTKTLKTPPLWFEFRTSILLANQIRDDHVRICYTGNTSPKTQNNSSNVQLKVLLIWRRDYIAHPRNPSGLVSRKVKNELEIERALKNHFSNFSIRGVQLDKLTIEEQLYLISHSDIIVSMHGAAMSFTVFMRPKSGVIELYPKYYKTYNWHMEYIAKWTGHYYKKWQNTDPLLENSKLGYTTVPTHIVISLIEDMATKLCDH